MNQSTKHLTLSACALAATLFLAACGGGASTDTTPPTVAITSAAGTGADVVFTFAFSEALFSGTFTAGDVVVTGGTAGAFTMVDSTHATLVVTPTTGAISASVDVNKFDDLAHNFNTVAASNTYTAPATAGTVVADFDSFIPVVRGPDSGGTGFITATPPAGGGSGSVLAVLRSDGQPWALNVLEASVPFTADRKTLSARVHSPTAGIRITMKVEGPAGAIELDSNETVVAGWQTLTWTFSNASTAVGGYNLLVILPNFMTVDPAPGKTYYFDDFTLLPAVVAPPTTSTDTVVADFDSVIPVVRGPDSGGTGFITATPPAGGGSGSVLAVLRSDGQPWALNVLEASVPFTADRKTLSARVHSPTAGIRMTMKVEGPAGAIELDSNETVVAGWQTLTWTFSNASTAVGGYNLLVILPNFMTVDSAPGKTYYFDDFKLLAATGAGGGTTTTAVDMGAGGAQTLTIATADVKTGDGGNTMFVANEGIFAVNYVGSAEATAPFNLAAWPSAKTANFTGITGVAGGDIGYFQDDANLSNSTQKVAEGGWVGGTALAPLGVPNFFRYFVLKGPVATSAYMGLYVNAPNNGTVNVSGFSKIKFKMWGPAPMFERTNFDPIIQMTLTGPKVAGCTTGSGGTEITQTFTANLKNGAGGAYTLPLSGFSVQGVCGADTNANAVANVRANLARVVVTVPGTSFNYTNLDGGNYATGVNLGPVGFTNL